MNRLHANLLKAGDDNIGNRWTFKNKTTAITVKTVTFARAIPLDVETQWKPSLHSLDSLYRGMGIEELTIAFPATSYPGYNAIDFHFGISRQVPSQEAQPFRFGRNTSTKTRCPLTTCDTI